MAVISDNYSLLIKGDGSFSIDGENISIPGIVITDLIGEGANGIVIKGFHIFLQRTVAVKFWTKLRPNDKRDKFRQGMLEARKAAEADRSKHTIRIHDAGEIQDKFYAVMDFFEGDTLHHWLGKTHANLAIRTGIARELLFESTSLFKMGLIHGDLHSKNVLISRSWAAGPEIPDFKIIDFGTSQFSQNIGFSKKRHWACLEETFNKLIRPFSISVFNSNARPGIDDPDEMLWWYIMAIRNIPFYLSALGAVDIIEPGRPLASLNDIQKYSPKSAHDLLVIKNSHQLDLSVEDTGSWYDWRRLQSAV